MSIGNRVFMKRPMPEQGLLDEFSRIPAANIADTMGRSCAMNPRIKLMSGADKIMVGPALTVKTRGRQPVYSSGIGYGAARRYHCGIQR